MEAQHQRPLQRFRTPQNNNPVLRQVAAGHECLFDSSNHYQAPRTEHGVIVQKNGKGKPPDALGASGGSPTKLISLNGALGLACSSTKCQLTTSLSGFVVVVPFALELSRVAENSNR